MDFDPQVSFEPAAWSDQVAADLNMIADVKPRDLAIFKERVQAGEFHLMGAFHQGERVGAVIWSIEHETDGRRSLVINAAAARPVPGADVTRELYERMVELARLVKASAFRCWTQRPGLVRKLETLGAKRRYVMEIEF